MRAERSEADRTYRSWEFIREEKAKRAPLLIASRGRRMTDPDRPRLSRSLLTDSRLPTPLCQEIPSLLGRHLFKADRARPGRLRSFCVDTSLSSPLPSLSSLKEKRPESV